MNKRYWIAALTVCCLVLAGMAFTAHAQPEETTISGVMADFTCANKGKAMMGSWHNATHDEHKTPDGDKPNCATMCLKNLGQPAALFDAESQEMTAVFACNPALTLGDFAAQEVEVAGFWAGADSQSPRAFVPQKIRTTGGEWQEVTCAQMH